MNPRVTIGAVGVITAGFGLLALFYPERIMGLLGFSVLNAAHAAAALGEVRAVYGGLFLVLGVFTILGAANPAAHRGRLLTFGALWLGVCLGRLVGVVVDGSPGLFGWLAVVAEGVAGSILVLAPRGSGH